MIQAATREVFKCNPQRCPDEKRLNLLTELERRYQTLKVEYLAVSKAMALPDPDEATLLNQAGLIHARLDELIWAMQLITLCATCEPKGGA